MKEPGEFSLTVLLDSARGSHVLAPLFPQNLEKSLRDHVAHQVITYLRQMQSIVPQPVTRSLVQFCVGDFAVEITGIASTL